MGKQNSKQNGSKTEAKRPPEVRSQKTEVITYGSDVLTPSVCIPKIDGVTALLAVNHG